MYTESNSWWEYDNSINYNFFWIEILQDVLEDNESQWVYQHEIKGFWNSKENAWQDITISNKIFNKFNNRSFSTGKL